MKYSFIIPVYNRPEEIDELLQSLCHQTYSLPFEVVVVEDGSSITCENIIQKYTSLLEINYLVKPNSGPGNSRNYGMKKAKGTYFIILDSDCIIPPQYLQAVDDERKLKDVDFFGGPDAALPSFSAIQKAINFTMTTFLTTGGIRGGSEKIGKFQPRSFNMGISKKAFEASGGFGNIHPGEDPDLAIRLWELGFQSSLFSQAFVYHKRRIDWKKFYQQVHKFGKARPILNQRYPQYAKITFWFPTLFCAGFLLALILLLLGYDWLLPIYILYFICLLLVSFAQTKSSTIAFYSIIAACIQFYGYGWGFLKASFLLKVLNKKAEVAMPEMFFKK